MYKQTTKQAELLDIVCSDAKEVLAYGGGRSGKTFEIVKNIIIRAIKEQSRHVILRDKFIHVKQSVWYDTLPKVMDTCFAGLSARCNWNKSDWYLTLPNKSEIWIGGLDDKERTEKILGKEYSTLYFNEISQIQYNAFLTAKTRLAQKNNLKKKIYADCNPPKRTHWTYKYFIEGVDPLTNTPHGNKTASLLMNPVHNKDNIDAEYLDMLSKLPPLIRKRFMEGEWISDENDIFRSEWLIPSEYQVKEADIGYKVTMIDPAFTEKEKETDNTCESSIVTIAVTYDMLIHDIEVLHGIWSYRELKDKVKSVYNRHKQCSNYVIGVEDVAAQKWLQQDLAEEGIIAILVQPIRDKVTRAISVTDLLEDGRCRVNNIDLRNQLLGFPSGKLKDMVDAYVYCLKLIKSFIKDKLERPAADRLAALKQSQDSVSLMFWEQYQKEQGINQGNHQDYNKAFNL